MRNTNPSNIVYTIFRFIKENNKDGINFFKKHTGFSPLEYRRNSMKDNITSQENLL